jgi:WD40 repeat protein
VNYHPAGAQIISTSPEGIAKLWDIKSGKSTADLKAHTKRVNFHR